MTVSCRAHGVLRIGVIKCEGCGGPGKEGRVDEEAVCGGVLHRVEGGNSQWFLVLCVCRGGVCVEAGRRECVCCVCLCEESVCEGREREHCKGLV